MAQDFPTTSHASFQGEAITIPEAQTIPLPPMQPRATPLQTPTTAAPVETQMFSQPIEFPDFSGASTAATSPHEMHSVSSTVIKNIQPPTVPTSDGQSCGCADGSQFPEDFSEVQSRHGVLDLGSRLRSRPAVSRPMGERLLPQKPMSPRSGSVCSNFSVSGLLFERNHGTNRDFSTNAGGELLSSDNAVSDVLGGIDATFARRNASGRGFEFRYFGLFPSDESIQIGNNATSLLPGLNQLGTSVSGTGPTAFLTGPSANSFYNSADTHVLTRQTELNNIEFNILKNSCPRFCAASTELLFGFRYFQFGETLLYEAVNIPQGDPLFASPSSIGYFSSVENQLLGLQIGGRSDYQLRSRLAMHVGVKAGAFNNNVQTRQRIDYRLRDGSVVNPAIAGGALGGQRFDIGAEDNVKSLMGEVDIAVSYQLSNRSRVRIGYRALGVTDVAFSSNQIQDDFTDATALQTPNTDGDLVLQGTYVGFELAY